ncbi:hypothetical protein CIB95_06535 [Lottiidibacillus patelloidae]|uniref:Uncharacterized protein n=1 Tax=Lottiidibacillus patelloidae TaxID=2670334 RepID=A0A263BUA4_9BACI|nr:hypothetical protein [Lottiidibacillus patelloidae]OZM57122.1 hypothetical protein CIB95_06535 [Lottiidibacillus patelloidae]
MSKKLRLNDYVKKFQAEEAVISNTGNDQLTSPHSAMSDEELRVFLPYMHSQNAFLVTKQIPERKKNLMLRLFLRSKRNQIADIKIAKSPLIDRGTEQVYQGRISAVGRDFVLLTTLQKKYWIPYTSVKSANIPTGIPDYSNSYQQVIYDNKLKQKLLKGFANTVLKRDELIQQFYEESLQTNLEKWIGTSVSITTVENILTFGKIFAVKGNSVELSRIGLKSTIPLSSILMLETVSPMTILLSFIIKKK